MKSSSANDAIQIAAKKGNDGDYDFPDDVHWGPSAASMTGKPWSGDGWRA